MVVKNLMQKNFITIRQDTSYQETAEILFKNKLSGVFVINENDELIGFVSEKDLFRILFPSYQDYYKHPEDYTDFEKRENKAHEVRHYLAEKLMSKNLITIRPDTSILTAGAIMLAHHVHLLPVVEDTKLVGIVSREQIYHRIFEKNFFEKN